MSEKEKAKSRALSAARSGLREAREQFLRAGLREAAENCTRALRRSERMGREKD